MLNELAISEAVISLCGNQYVLKQTVLKQIAVTDAKGNTVLTAKPRGLSATLDVYYNGVVLELEVRNNPLAEWVLKSGNKELLAYGLKPEGPGVVTVITSPRNDPDFLFDCLMWFLFLPIVMENACENV